MCRPPPWSSWGSGTRTLPIPPTEAGWIEQILSAEVVMIPEAGHYPQSQQPGLTSDAVLRFLKGMTSGGTHQGILK